MVLSKPNKAKSRVRRSQVRYLHITHLGSLKQETVQNHLGVHHLISEGHGSFLKKKIPIFETKKQTNKQKTFIHLMTKNKKTNRNQPPCPPPKIK